MLLAHAQKSLRLNGFGVFHMYYTGAIDQITFKTILLLNLSVPTLYFGLVSAIPVQRRLLVVGKTLIGSIRMNGLRKQERSIEKTTIYEIKLQGRLDEDWSDWFEGMTICHEGETAVLKGKVTDQAALRGILTKIWDLNRTVISVNQIRD